MRLGEREMRILLYLHFPNAIGQFVVAPGQIGDLLDQVLVDRPLDRSRAYDDTGAAQQRRHETEDGAADGLDRGDRAGRRTAFRHQVQERLTMPFLMLQRLLEPREQIGISRLRKRDLGAIDRYRALLS